MTVDRTADGFVATTVGGASARCRTGPDGDDWNVTVPPDAEAAGRLDELEDLLTLVLTTGWRRAGWVPVHAAAVARDGVAAVLCAPSGGGKSTLTAALLAAGWRAVGDDKLLLRTGDDGRPELAALLHTFNLHPRTSEWLPEVGDLEQLPVYSSWTEKRKVRAGDLWPDAVALAARPTHVVDLQRDDGVDGVHVAALATADVLPLLLRQTVVPTDRDVARTILSTLAATSRHVTGVRLRIGRDAYRDPAAAALVGAAIA
jgi:hypothetical protein